MEEEDWEEYLEEQIDFPFKATYEDEYRKIKDTDILKVHGISSDDPHYGIIMKCKFGRKTIYLPLCELSVDGDESQETLNAVDLYKKYFRDFF